jgi:acetyl esterase/lipase
MHLILPLAVLLVALLAVAAFAARFALRLLSLAGRRRGQRVERAVAYGPLPLQSVDITTPQTVAPAAPAVVFFHGGGWSSGRAADYGFVGAALAAAGLIVVVADYRLYPAVRFPDFVHDTAQAVALTAGRFADRRIVLAGHSAGAHIAALLALDPRYLAAAGVPRHRIAGVIGISGPYDFLPLTRQRYRRIFPEAHLADSQPIRFADGSAAPMLLVTGDRDRGVLPGNTLRFADAIRAGGGRVATVVYPGVGHLATVLAFARIWPWRKPPVRRDLVAFVNSLADNPPG